MAQNEIKQYKVIAIGGSAGSLEIVLKIIACIRDNPQVVFIIILHRRNDNESALRDLLAYRTQLAVKEVEDKDAITPGTIYLAPPDYHLLLDDTQTFSLDSSEKIHFSRPSIDVSFESVAAVFGNAVIGVLLSGANADGAKGLETIQQAGGYTIVQSPASAEIDFMPKTAINQFKPDCITDGNDIGDVLNDLLGRVS